MEGEEKSYSSQQLERGTSFLLEGLKEEEGAENPGGGPREGKSLSCFFFCCCCC